MRVTVSILGQNKRQVEVRDDATVLNLQTAVYLKTGICESEVRLKWDNRFIRSDEKLSDLGIRDEAELYMFWAMSGAGGNRHFYLESHRGGPSLLRERPIPIGATISVKRPTFEVKYLFYTKLDDLLGVAESSFQNKWPEYQPFSDFFTDEHVPERVVVLKLSPEFAEGCASAEVLETAIGLERYDCDGINRSYYGGDTRSWQRFTRQMPLKTSLEAIDSGGEDPRIKCTLEEDLEPNTWYLLGLLHVGIGRSLEKTIHIREDVFFPFQTTADLESPAAASGGGHAPET